MQLNELIQRIQADQASRGQQLLLFDSEPAPTHESYKVVIYQTAPKVIFTVYAPGEQRPWEGEFLEILPELSEVVYGEYADGVCRKEKKWKLDSVMHAVDFVPIVDRFTSFIR